MPKVEMKRTKYDEPTLGAALVASLKSAGVDVDRTLAAMLLAHLYFETSDGVNMWNNNVGNITTADTSADYWQPSKGAASKLKFRVYPSLELGMDDYVATLKRASPMLKGAATGDTAKFAAAIKSTGYTGDIDVAHVADILEQKTREILGKATFADLPEGATLTNSGPSMPNKPSKPSKPTTTLKTTHAGHALGIVLAFAAVLGMAGVLLWRAKRV